MISLPSVVLRLVVALVLGALVGLERERGARAAGLRTLALVSLGSCLITIVSAYGFVALLGTPGISYDPSRVAAQIVTGIGFLGAGTILLQKQTIRGLTTAASIWFVAGVGLACGTGMLAPAGAATALGLIVLAALRPVERLLFPRRQGHILRLRIEPGMMVGQLIDEVAAICMRAGAVVDTWQMRAARHGEVVELRCRALDPLRLARALVDLRALPGVRDVRADLGAGRLPLAGGQDNDDEGADR